jgi:hypothetical protein
MLLRLLLLLLPVQEPDMQEHIRCMRMVGLSALQQQQVADGFQVFSRLMEPVLQVRLCAAAAAAAAACVLWS